MRRNITAIAAEITRDDLNHWLTFNPFPKWCEGDHENEHGYVAPSDCHHHRYGETIKTTWSPLGEEPQTSNAHLVIWQSIEDPEPHIELLVDDRDAVEFSPGQAAELAQELRDMLREVFA